MSGELLPESEDLHRYRVYLLDRAVTIDGQQTVRNRLQQSLGTVKKPSQFLPLLLLGAHQFLQARGHADIFDLGCYLTGKREEYVQVIDAEQPPSGTQRGHLVKERQRPDYPLLQKQGHTDHGRTERPGIPDIAHVIDQDRLSGSRHILGNPLFVARIEDPLRLGYHGRQSQGAVLDEQAHGRPLGAECFGGRGSDQFQRLIQPQA